MRKNAAIAALVQQVVLLRLSLKLNSLSFINKETPVRILTGVKILFFVYTLKGGIFVENTKTIATNKKAYHEYFVLESFEAGISLSGTEVKSVRQGGVNLKDAWCSVDNGEMIIKQMHISPYEKGNIFNKQPTRERKLLLHKREIMRLFGLVKQQQGLTLIPLSIYFKGSLVKVQLGVCRGKKLYDKRDAEAKRQADRTMERYVKSGSREY